MGLIEEVQELKSSGALEDKITAILQERGYPKRDIADAISQSQIRDAVSSDSQYSQEANYSDSQQDMRPSLLSNKVPAVQEYSQQDVPQNYPQETQNQGYGQYQQYDQNSYTPPASSDTISEISEQIVSEKLSPIRDQLEKIIDMRNSFEAKAEYLDERLKRIEHIIDKLQLSILEKVGDQVNNIQSIKDELIETQKSFKSLLNKSK
ncbi:MAG: hypothetical protein Q7R87_00360 [Nanoarchaeota archaeon]|nr:hypothetical protein [Nanoarchaeota archaeon]